MGRRLIEVVGLLVDQIHQGGYQHRVLEDSIYTESQKRIAAEKDRDHWRQARQDAMAAGELMQAEIETLRQQLADAQKQSVDTTDDYEGQIAAAEARIDPEANGETTISGMADEIEHLRRRLTAAQDGDGARSRDELAYLRTRLEEERSVSAKLRQELDAARAETVDVRRRLNDETDRHRATNAEKVEHWDHLQIANRNAAEFVRERDAAHQTILMQRQGIERLQAIVGKVRHAQNNYQWPESWNEITAALAELDDQPTPATETEGGQ